MDGNPPQPKNQGGRPPAEETRKKREESAVKAFQMAYNGLGEKDIASLLGLKEANVSKWFKKEIEKGRAHRRLKISTLQMEAAERGDSTILKVLGEAELGQGKGNASGNEGKAPFQLIVYSTPKNLDGPPPPPVRQLPDAVVIRDEEVVIDGEEV